MTKINICSGEGGVVSLDTSDFTVKSSGKADSKVTESLRAEFAMKIRGTRGVKDQPAKPEDVYSGVTLNMFPLAENGDVLLEGRVILTGTGDSSELNTGALVTDRNQIIPDDMLLGGFIGERVQIVKYNDGILVRKIVT